MKRARSRPHGLTLLEVLLAMAITAMVLSALAQLQDTGARAAINASLEAEATLLCQSEMDAWLAGNRQAELKIMSPVHGAMDWSRRITLQPIASNKDGSDLRMLTVEIFHGRSNRPVSTLVRWVPTPAMGVRP